MRLQGTPDKTDSFFNRWHYGSSFIKFDSADRVVEWDNRGDNLKIVVEPGGNATESQLFTIGLHKDDVARLQGTPDKIDSFFNRWHYGSSFIKFDSADRVVEWDNRGDNLKVEATL